VFLNGNIPQGLHPIIRDRRKNSGTFIKPAESTIPSYTEILLPPKHLLLFILFETEMLKETEEA
jgi:hypothetical protein